MRYVLLFVAFIGSFLALSAYIALPGSALNASVQPPEPKTVSFLSPDRPEVLFRAFRHAFYDKQGNAWELEAKEAALLRSSAKTDLTDLRLHLTTPDGKIFLLEADKGRILFTKDFGQPVKITLWGHTKAHFSNGITLTTDSLTFTPENRRLATQDPVHIEGPGVWLEGKGLEASFQGNQNLKLGGTPRTRLEPSKLSKGAK
jgi:LPS export ABC transporter protein LptC